MRDGLARLVAVLLVAGFVACTPAPRERSPRVVVGVGSTIEQRVLVALAVTALEAAGFAPEVTTAFVDTPRLRLAALRGEVDLYWDYTGAAWALGLDQQAPPADPVESYQRVREADRENGLVWLEPSAANVTLALFVRSEEVPQDQPATLTWLSSRLSAGGERLCADPDFIERPGGLDALALAYAISLEQVVPLASTEEQAIRRVAAGRCFAGLATATSGTARNAGLVPVADDLLVFPAFVVAPVVRAALLEDEPRIATALERVVARLDTRRLAELNARVEAGADAESLAERFLAPPPADAT